MDTKRIGSESLAAHWYTREGEPCHEVPYADASKGMRPTTLRDARKLWLLPSVTSILKMYPRKQLDAWKIRNAVECALTLPREEGETDAAYIDRLCEDMQRQSQEAMELGTAVHDAIACYLRGEDFGPTVQGQAMQVFIHWMEWAKCIEEIHDVEEVVVGEGYAGTVDFVGVIDGELCIVDWKTTAGKPGKPLSAWDSYGLQLVAYSEAMMLGAAPKIYNVMICTNPDDFRVEVVDWTSKYVECFDSWDACRELWCAVNKYYPMDRKGGER